GTNSPPPYATSQYSSSTRSSPASSKYARAIRSKAIGSSPLEPTWVFSAGVGPTRARGREGGAEGECGTPGYLARQSWGPGDGGWARKGWPRPSRHRLQPAPGSDERTSA